MSRASIPHHGARCVPGRFLVVVALALTLEGCGEAPSRSGAGSPGAATASSDESGSERASRQLPLKRLQLTPADPTSMLLMAVPLSFLYVGGVLLCKYLPKKKSPFETT